MGVNNVKRLDSLKRELKRLSEDCQSILAEGHWPLTKNNLKRVVFSLMEEIQREISILSFQGGMTEAHTFISKYSFSLIFRMVAIENLNIKQVKERLRLLNDTHPKYLNLKNWIPESRVDLL